MGARYRLIAGRQRIEAYRLLQRTHIPAHVVPGDDQQAALMRLTENLTRTNLSPIEEAAQLNDLLDTLPGGIDAVAAATGRPTTWILDRLDLLAWDPDLQQAVHARRLSLGAAKRLARIPDPETRHRLVHAAVAHGINARTAALWLQDATRTPAPESELSEKANLEPLQNEPPQTYVTCFVCGTKAEITTTYAIRICPDCCSTLQNSLKTPPMQEN